jgi:hypothetical protein
MNRQLTVPESRHRLGRKICHGHRGQIRQAYREGQEDQLAALGLALNAVVPWNTRYLDAIVESLRRWRGRRRVLTSPARASRRGTCDLSWPARADVTGTGDGRHGRESRSAAMLDL